MGFGLILLLIAEDRKKIVHLRATPTKLELTLTEPPRTEAANLPVAKLEIQREVAPREADEWSFLVASDEDLSRVVTIVTPLGQKYVDQLARAYVIFNIKAYLPTILNMIIGSARKDAGLLTANDPGAGRVSAIGLERIYQPQDKDDEGSGGNATDEPVTEVTDPHCTTTPVLSEEISDELENLKDLLNRLDLASSKHRQR